MRMHAVQYKYMFYVCFVGLSNLQGLLCNSHHSLFTFTHFFPETLKF